MIVFIDDPQVVEALRYKFGDDRDISILNLSSFYSGYRSITNLITNIVTINNTNMNPYEFVDSVEFDTQFTNCVLNDINLFRSLMDIMIRVYNNMIVCILVQRDPYRDSVMESLIKLIQQRYGYNSWIVQDMNDIEVIEDELLLVPGLTMLNKDIELYNSMVAKGYTDLLLSPDINIE